VQCVLRTTTVPLLVHVIYGVLEVNSIENHIAPRPSDCLE
jgi:hypothetical protein